MPKVVKVAITTHRKVTVWHTPDFHVWTQGAFWYNVNNCLQFTPAKPFGLVCITPQGEMAGKCTPIVGYIIFRPRALVLDIPENIEVKRRAVDHETMQDWYKRGKPWMHVRVGTR